MRRNLKNYRFLPLDHVPVEPSAESPDDPRLQPFYFSGGGSAPDPPDYEAAAREQGVADKETAVTNAAYARPNQVTPQGSQNWQFKGKDINNPQPGDWQVSTELNPYEKYLYGKELGNKINLQKTAGSAIGRVDQQLGSQFDMSGISGGTNPDQINQMIQALTGVRSQSGSIPQSAADFAAMGKQAADANYAETTKYYDDRFTKGEAAMDTQLRNQGLQPGTEAYKNAATEFNRSRNDAYGSAAQQAVGVGNDVANRNFQNSIAAATSRQGLDTGAQNALIQAIQSRMGSRQSQIEEEAYLRSLPLNEANALRMGNQVSMPQFSAYQGGTAQSAPMYQATNDLYSNQVGNYNAEQASQASQNQGLYSAAGTAAMMMMMASDRRLKRNIERIGTMDSGLPWYSFEYIEEPGVPQEGVMADEVVEVFPEAVFVGPNGYSQVAYGRIA
jgi:hypothetical protein